MLSENCHIIGRLMGPFGIKGEMRIILDAIHPDSIMDSHIPIYIQKTSQKLTLTSFRAHQKFFIVRFKEIMDRTQAEQIPKSSLMIPQDQIHEIEGFEHYSIIGYKVMNKNNQFIGTVLNVEEHGAGPLLEISLDNEKKSFLVPFTDDIIVAENHKEEALIVSDDILFFTEFAV